MKVIRIGQAHVALDDNFANYKDKSVQLSQYKVGKAILDIISKHPNNTPVILEESVFDKFEENHDDCHKINAIYPQGWPKEFEGSAAMQKEVFPYGAAKILCCLGRIKEVYPAANEEIESNIPDTSKVDIAENIMSMITFDDLKSNEFSDDFINSVIIRYLKENGYTLQREVAALKLAKEAIKEANVDTAVIVYGAAHDFTDACNDVGCESLESFYTQSPEEVLTHEEL